MGPSDSEITSNEPSLKFAVKRLAEIAYILESLAQDYTGTASGELMVVKDVLGGIDASNHPVAELIVQDIYAADRALGGRVANRDRAVGGASTHLRHAAEKIEKWLLEEFDELILGFLIMPCIFLI